MPVPSAPVPAGPEPSAGQTPAATAPSGAFAPGTWSAPARHPDLTPRPPASPVRRLLAPVGSLAAVAGAFTYVGLIDPNHPGHYPVCPLFALTGLYCPGCGGLRSAHAVAHGDLVAALGDNALAVLGYGAAAVLWVLWTVRSVRGSTRRPLPIPRNPALWWAVGGVVLIFTLIRNLPFGSSLAP
ncbi:DUF2752 domain-containing protein [Streptomyces liangshanensis]|uniref:DUF2752 domain-containing protein n=1 Tax=Streptomyces liangshanensis TaxID=2717324 RepID=A0A6G9H9F0_9ACTN|nr:DUF2752 domain-containing protein [Streptomyces liangshanensis]